MEEQTYRQAYLHLFSATTSQLEALKGIRATTTGEAQQALGDVIAALKQAQADGEAIFIDMFEASIFSPSILPEDIAEQVMENAETGEGLVRKLFRDYWLSGGAIYLGFDRFIKKALKPVPRKRASAAAERITDYLDLLETHHPDYDTKLHLGILSLELVSLDYDGEAGAKAILDGVVLKDE